MTKSIAVKRLFKLWLMAPLIPIIILVVQSMAGKYGDDVDLAWTWMFGQFSPIISILLAAVFADPEEKWKRAKADNFRIYSAIVLSIIQIISILIFILIEPEIRMTPFQIFSMTAIPLTVLQGLVVAAVGS